MSLFDICIQTNTHYIFSNTQQTITLFAVCTRFAYIFGKAKNGKFNFLNTLCVCAVWVWENMCLDFVCL